MLLIQAYLCENQIIFITFAVKKIKKMLIQANFLLSERKIKK